MKNTISRLCGLLLLGLVMVGCSAAGVPQEAAPAAAAPAPTPAPLEPICLGIIDFDGEKAYSLYATKPNKVVGWTFHLNFRGVSADNPTINGCFRVYVRDEGNTRFTPIDDGIEVRCSVNDDSRTFAEKPIVERSHGSTDGGSIGAVVLDNTTITCPFNIQQLLQQANITNTVDHQVKEKFVEKNGGSVEEFDRLIANYVTSDTHTYDDLTIVAAVSDLAVKDNGPMTLASYMTYKLDVNNDTLDGSSFFGHTCAELRRQSNEPVDLTQPQYWWYDIGTHELAGQSVTNLQLARREVGKSTAYCVGPDSGANIVPPVTLSVAETHTLTIGPLTGTVYEVLIDPIDAKPPAG